MSSPTISEKSSYASRPTVEAEPSPLEKFAQDSLASFIDDLEAANRFKTYLLSVGVEIPSDVLEGLAKLADAISSQKSVVPAYGASTSNYGSHSIELGASP